MNKNKRQSLILEIIAEREIENQNALKEELLSRGVPVTQATLSRDVRELNLTKCAGARKKKKFVYNSFNLEISDELKKIMSDIIKSAEYAENMVVIKTRSGGANTVAAILDDVAMPEILGSVAGDDVIFMVAHSKTDAENTVKRIKGIIANAD